MKIIFSNTAHVEYLDFKRSNNQQAVKKINMLLDSIIQDGAMKGLGKPEVLKYYVPKAMSRRISKEHR